MGKEYIGQIVDENGTLEFFEIPQKELDRLQKAIDNGELDKDLESEIVKSIEEFLEKN